MSREWSSTAKSDWAAYFLDIGGVIHSAADNERYFGFMVRVAKPKDIYYSSIYLTRGGVVGKTSGSLRYVGIDGYFWTLSAYENSLFAFTIYFSNLAVNSSNNYNRWNGFTVQTSSQERRLMLSNQNLY